MTYEETLAAFRRGDNGEAERLAELDLAAARAAGHAPASVDALCMLARVALRAGRLDVVAQRAAEAELLAEDAGNPAVGRMPLHLLAVAARMKGDYDEARRLYLSSISLNDELGEERMAAAEHRNLAYGEIRAGRVDSARELFAESRRRFATLDASAMLPYLTVDDATLAALDGDYETAAAKLHEADRLFEQQGVAPDPDDAFEIADLRHRIGQS
ncbi:MAG: hypothetical protein ACTHK4_11165 [Mycobacteriales bacterium]